MTSTRLCLISLLTACATVCAAQETGPALDRLFAADHFTLVEQYTGDWGGQADTLEFTRQGDSIRVHPVHKKPLQAVVPPDAWISAKDLQSLKDLFVECSRRIEALAHWSTEHIVYSFTAPGHAFTLDDRFSMACHEEYKAWKEAALGRSAKR